MTARVDVYCPACGHRGKARSADELGRCTRCGADRVPGKGLPTGRPVGRPRLASTTVIRRYCTAILAELDRIDDEADGEK